MTILMLMVIILSTITSVVNMRTSKVVAQIDPPTWLQVEPTSLRYKEFIQDNGSLTLTVLYSATIDNDARALQLTSPGLASGKTDVCQGLVIYSKSIPFQGINWKTKRCSTPSFSTFFSFSLPPAIPSSFTHQSKSPFAFFLLTIPVNSSANGATLNLSSWTSDNMKPPIRVIAIEYGMCTNKVSNDTNTSCIGTGTENPSSLARKNARVLDLPPDEGSLRYSWVDYNDTFKELEVRISSDSNKPHHPFIKKSIDLTPIYSNLMYVRFSSQTHSKHANKVSIHSWSFETHPDLASLVTPNKPPSLALGITPNEPMIASVFSPTPDASVPLIASHMKSNTTVMDRATYFGKVLGTTLSVLLLIMLLLGILVGFSQFGFACIANPDDLIEMEFSTLGELSSSGEHGKENIEEALEGKLDSSSEEQESPKNKTMQKLLAQAKKQPDSQVIYGEEYYFGRGSVWGDEFNYHGSPKVEAPVVDSRTPTTIQGGRKPSRSSIATMILGHRRSSTVVKEPFDPPSDLSTTNEKEKISTLLKEAAQVEEEVEATRYQHKELSEATNGFGSSNKLGGDIAERYATYRGFLPDYSTEIAVKVINIELLKTKSKEVWAEMSILNRLQHPNLVKFLGWCKHKGQFYVVYELMRGQSLDRILFENDGCVATYPWEKRFETIKAIASALHYLHEGWKSPIIHRNLKPSSVMIERDQRISKLGDYGLSCLIDMNQTEPSHTSSLYFQDATFGYLAPEFSKSKTGTQHTDVYSFGILCLEIACQRRVEDHARALEEQSLVKWVSYLKDEEKLTDAIEDDIMTEIEVQQFVLVLRLCLMCVDLLPQERPTMKQVVQCLSGEIPFPAIPISETTDLEEELVSNWEDSIVTQEDPVYFKNKLFESQNEWSDIDFLLGDAAHSFAPSKQTNKSWVDIRDNILFISNNTKPCLSPSQRKNTWVDIHDNDILIGNDGTSLKSTNLENCLWVDDIDISLDDILKPISFQKGEERTDTAHQSSGLKVQQMQETTLWTEIPTLNLTCGLVSQSAQVDQPICLQWVENSEVFNTFWANTHAQPFWQIEGRYPQSVHHMLTALRPLPGSLRVEKTHLIPNGNNLPPGLPPPTWPLPLPKLKPNRKHKKQNLALDDSHAHSFPSLQAKGTQTHLNNPSTPSSLSTSYKSPEPDSTFPSSGLSSTLGSSLLSSSSPFPPSNHSNRTISTSSPHLADNPKQEPSHFGSRSSSSRTSQKMKLIDLKNHSDNIKYARKSPLPNTPDKDNLLSSKNKFNPTSQLHLFQPKWPIPLRKSNHVEK